MLVNFYSPWTNKVQLEYIQALEEYDQTSFDPSKKTEVAAKVDSLRNSLRLLNVMDMDIMRIKNSRKVQNTIQLMAPQGGIVTRLNVNEGSYVEPYQSMFTIVDLSQVSPEIRSSPALTVVRIEEGGQGITAVELPINGQIDQQSHRLATVYLNRLAI